MSLKTYILLLSVCTIFFSACVEHSRDAMRSTEINVNASEALEYLTDLAEDNQDNPEVFYQLSKVYFDQASYGKALQNIQKAIDVKQDYAEYHLMEGKVYQKLNEPEPAIKSLLLAESMGKSNEDLYKIIAEEYLRLGQSDKARKAVDRLTSMNQSAEAYTLKGQIMLSLGDTALAIQNFNKSVAIDQEYVKPYIALADISIARNNNEEAFRVVNHLIRLEPENVEFLELKGNLWQRTGELDSAKWIFQNIASSRDNYMDYYKLSNIYYLQGKYDSAQLLAEKAFLMNEEFLEAKLVIARSLDKRREYQKAMEVYELIIASDSTFNLAITELDNLKRKVAYLWRLEQQRKAQDTVKKNVPPPVQKIEIDDNKK